MSFEDIDAKVMDKAKLNEDLTTVVSVCSNDGLASMRVVIVTLCGSPPQEYMQQGSRVFIRTITAGSRKRDNYQRLNKRLRGRPDVPCQCDRCRTDAQ